MYEKSRPDSPGNSQRLSLLYKQIVRDDSDLNKP